MFSYRHAFHAGNHADVLKHLALIAVLRYLMRKPAPLLLVDTHAGAGLYLLDDQGEAAQGILKLQTRGHATMADGEAPDALTDYLGLIQRFNATESARPWRVYPGSPALMHALMREPARAATRDRLRLFEWHPTESRVLADNIAQWRAGRRVTMEQADGFAALTRLLPPPATAGGSRRAFVLIDPSYEIKSDYAQVAQAIEAALRRFATGVYLVWYPVIDRPQARELPMRLQAIAGRAGRNWLHAVLDVGAPDASALPDAARRGLAASAVFVINPPHTLAASLQASLPAATEILGRGRGQCWRVEQG